MSSRSDASREHGDQGAQWRRKPGCVAEEADEVVAGTVEFSVDAAARAVEPAEALNLQLDDGREFAAVEVEGPLPECAPPGCRTGWLEPDEDIAALARRLGRRFAPFGRTGGAYAVSLPGQRGSSIQRSWTFAVATAAAEVITADEIAALALEDALPQEAEVHVRRRLYELGVARGWKIPGRRLSPAPAVVAVRAPCVGGGRPQGGTVGSAHVAAG